MGKATKGMITISCETDAEHWVIHFVDDGRGINVGRVVQKALDNGQITPDALADMSYEQKLSLIFLSGISTSDNVTDISGRGVGMNAVHQAVQDAGGRLTI
ncbi:MAG: ATP-binding protein [Pseudobdellovibrionaceae bacterium]|nr:ATP-binding protein [Pseudobdellovibrionaceae bacterium]